jgi:hypothetical protein
MMLESLHIKEPDTLRLETLAAEIMSMEVGSVAWGELVDCFAQNGAFIRTSYNKTGRVDVIDAVSVPSDKSPEDTKLAMCLSLYVSKLQSSWPTIFSPHCTYYQSPTPQMPWHFLHIKLLLLQCGFCPMFLAPQYFDEDLLPLAVQALTDYDLSKACRLEESTKKRKRVEDEDTDEVLAELETIARNLLDQVERLQKRQRRE